MSIDGRPFWNEIAPTYDQLYQSAWSQYEDSELEQWLKEAFGDRIEVRVLDIGCGTGLGYKLVKRIMPTCEYVGIDISKGMIEEFHKKIGAASADDRLSLYVAPAHELVRLFPESAFDVVLLLNGVASYVGGPSKVLKDGQHLLKPNGALFASFLNRASLRRCLRGNNRMREVYSTRGAGLKNSGVHIVLPKQAELKRRCERYGFDLRWVRHQSVLGGVLEKYWLIRLEGLLRRIVPRLCSATIKMGIPRQSG
jgi:ubiquinone/menaquinone biosynthesis C-methylase UbiE